MFKNVKIGFIAAIIAQILCYSSTFSLYSGMKQTEEKMMKEAGADMREMGAKTGSLLSGFSSTLLFLYILLLTGMLIAAQQNFDSINSNE